MKCIIVDDDGMSRLVLGHHVERTQDIELVGSFENVNSAILFLRTETVDLLFLDVEMPELSGMEYVENFKDLPQVIFVTSESSYAAKAFDHDATDFLVKPVGYARFLRAVEKARRLM